MQRLVIMKIAVVLGALVGCATPQQPAVGWSGRLAGGNARTVSPETGSQVSGESFSCGDTVLADQTTSGGERLGLTTPCFEETVVPQRRPDVALVHQPVAAPNQPTAQEDAQLAANLSEVDLHNCQGVSERERQHSPFTHKHAIAQVVPHREGNAVRGVRIVFFRIPGLTAKWLERDIQCHQARYAILGKPMTYLPGDPTLVAGAHVSVSEHDHQLEVLIETTDTDNGQLALQKAQDLIAPVSALK